MIRSWRCCGVKKIGYSAEASRRQPGLELKEMDCQAIQTARPLLHPSLKPYTLLEPPICLCKNSITDWVAGRRI
jgi:hypothetical protein